MIDLHLYLGKPLQAKDDTKKPADEMVAYYGSVPTGLLDVGMEWIKEQIDGNSDLGTAFKSMENATKLYVKTRPVSSPESIKRSKALGIIPIHPTCTYDFEIYLVYFTKWKSMLTLLLCTCACTWWCVECMVCSAREYRQQYSWSLRTVTWNPEFQANSHYI